MPLLDLGMKDTIQLFLVGRGDSQIQLMCSVQGSQEGREENVLDKWRPKVKINLLIWLLQLNI